MRKARRTGKRTKYRYDASGNPILEENALGNQTGYEYNAAGNLFSETDALGRTTNRYVYVRNNPVMYADPSGEIPALLISGLVVSITVYASAKPVTQVAAKTYVDYTEKRQKTTRQLVETVKANADFQGLVDRKP